MFVMTEPLLDPAEAQEAARTVTCDTCDGQGVVRHCVARLGMRQCGRCEGTGKIPSPQPSN